MTTIAKVFIVLNFVLSVFFVGVASTLLYKADNFRSKYEEETSAHAKTKADLTADKQKLNSELSTAQSSVDSATRTSQDLGRALGGCLAGVVGASAFAIAIGALLPRYPLVFALGWFAAEQVLFLIPNVAKLSPLYHARFLAGQPVLKSEPESHLAAAVWLAALTVGLVLVAIWRVTKAEYARADA